MRRRISPHLPAVARARCHLDAYLPDLRPPAAPYSCLVSLVPELLYLSFYMGMVDIFACFLGILAFWVPCLVTQQADRECILGFVLPPCSMPVRAASLPGTFMHAAFFERNCLSLFFLLCWKRHTALFIALPTWRSSPLWCHHRVSHLSGSNSRCCICFAWWRFGFYHFTRSVGS